MTPSPLRIPPIYDILTPQKGVQWQTYYIRKKFLEKFLGKIRFIIPPLIMGGYIYLI